MSKGMTATQTREKVRLFITFSALESFRICYLRLCFWISEDTGLLDLENMIFVLFSLAVVIGMISVPLIFDKSRLRDNPAVSAIAVRVSILLTAAAAIASYYAKGHLALAFQFVTTCLTSGVMAVCLRRLAGGLFPVRHIGRFIGLSFAVMALSGAVLFFLPFAEIPTQITLIVMCAFLAMAAVCFDANGSGSEQAEESEGCEASLSARILRLTLLVLCLYVLAGGLLDNIYFFDEAFEIIPNFMFFILMYAFICDIAAGFVFGRVSSAAAVIAAFVLICVGQSMSFFSQNVLLVYPYTIFSNAGNNMMEIFLISLPVAYCACTRRKPGILSGLGYILLYGSFFLTSILFEFIPTDIYKHILGVLLLVSVTAIVITFYIMQEKKNNQFKRLATEFEDKLASALNGTSGSVPAGSFIKHFKFTKRETEVLLLLLDGKSTNAISGQMNVTEKTVQNYINSLLSKTGMKSRSEMIAKFINGNGSG